MIEFLRRLAPFSHDYLSRYLLVALGMAMVAVGSATPVYLIKPILNQIFVARDEQMLLLLPPLVILAYGVLGIGKYVQAYNTAYIGEDVVRRLRDQMLGRLLELDLDFFNRSRGGELISRTTSDFARIRAALSHDLALMFREALTIVAFIGVAIYQSPRLAFYGLVVLPVAGYPLAVLGRRMKRLMHRSQQKDSDIASRLAETFNNMEIIKAHASEPYELERFHRDNLEFFRINMKGVRTRELTSPLMEFVGAIAVALVIIFGGSQVIDGRVDMGTFFSFATALFMVYTPLKRISLVYNKMFDAVAASERVFDVIGRRPAIVGGSRRLDEPVVEVEVRDVALDYSGVPALEGVSLRAVRGETVALVGDSGGGKTSLVNLILRLYDPSRGAILLNGVDAREVELRSLRDRIGIVTQRVFIFNDSVAANVAYGSPLDEGRVEEALRQAGAWEFVSRLEGGMHATLDEFGVNLSGGQRQRLAIARALYKQPDILILDEATSALDNRTEADLQDALARILHGKITFIIAHRLSSVDLADRIVVLQGGRVVGEGTKDHLLATCPEYQRLVAAGRRAEAEVTPPA